MENKIEIEKVFELSGHATGIYSLTHGLKENTVLTASADSFIASWDIEKRTADEFSVKAEGGCYSAHFEKSQNLLWVGRVNGDVHVIDTRSKKEIKFFQLHKKGVFDIQYLPAQKLFLTAGGDGVLGIWKAHDLTLLRNIQLSDKKLRKIAVHKNDPLVAVSSSNGLIYLLETDLFNSVETLRGDPQVVAGLAFHPTKPVLMSAGKNAHIKAWKIIENNCELLINVPAHNEIIYDIVFSPDGKYYATCSRDKTIKIWDAQTTDFITKIDFKENAGHRRSINTLYWSRFENILVSAGDDAKLMGWKIR